MASQRLFRVYNGRTEYEGSERRQKPRIYYPIPIRIRFRGSCGERIEFDTIVDNMSAGGLSAHAWIGCNPGQRLFLLMRFSLKKGSSAKVATVAARGIVLRSEKRFNGSYVFASMVSRHRFV